MENEKHPLDHLKNDEITENREKWEIHGRHWNRARKLKIMEKEKHPLDLKNDETTEKREKWDMHTVGLRIWQENLK